MSNADHADILRSRNDAITACLDWWRACPADAREALRGWVS